MLEIFYLFFFTSFSPSLYTCEISKQFEIYDKGKGFCLRTTTTTTMMTPVV